MATRYWVGGGSSTNWDATGNTNWSASSGGANNASVPTTGDDVVFDASSGSGTSVMNVALSLNSLDCNGFTGTLTHNAVTLTITGNDAGAPGGKTFRLNSGMTYAPSVNTRLVTMTATSGTSTITCAGKSLGSLTLNGVGGTFQAADNLSVIAIGTITLTNGTFDANGKNITTGFFSSSNSNIRVITMGSGTWTINGVGGNVWDITTATNCSLTGSGTLAFAAVTQTSSRGFVSGSLTGYPAVTIATNNAKFTFLTSGSPTFASLALTGPLWLSITQSTTITITAAFTWTGSGSAAFLIQSASSSSAATIGAASGSTIQYATIQNITFSGTTVAATNSFDLGGNTGATITGPSGGGVVGVIGS